MATIPSDGAKKAIDAAIEKVLGSERYQPGSAQTWAADVLTETCAQLPATAKGGEIKTVVSCSILESGGAGFYSSSTGFWEPKTDGSMTVTWSDKSTTMTCIVTVWWVNSRIVGVTPSEEHVYPSEAIKEICSKQMDTVVGPEQKYSHGACKDWAEKILGSTVADLTALQKPFKYVVSCQMLQLQPVTGQDFPPYGEWAKGTADDEEAKEVVKAVAPTEGVYGKIGASGTGFNTACSAIWDGQADASLTYSRDVSGGALRCIIAVHGLYDSDTTHRPS